VTSSVASVDVTCLPTNDHAACTIRAMSEAAAGLTIDQLAQRTGMSARNIRAHQSRGLLAPPALRGRTGYYGDDHVARVELIQTLQDDGFGLALIQRLLRVAGDSTGNLARLAAVLHEPFGPDEPRVVATEELEQRFHTRSTEVRTTLEELGFLRPVGNGQLEEVTPLAFRGGEVFADLGVPAEDLVMVAAELRKQLDRVATTCMRLFVDYVWKPCDQAGEQEKGMDRLLQAVQRLRPLGSAAVGSLFQLAMSEALEQRFGSELERLEFQRGG
jgi:DNA-binding transcriptional MerR regulator